MFRSQAAVGNESDKKKRKTGGSGSSNNSQLLSSQNGLSKSVSQRHIIKDQ